MFNQNENFLIDSGIYHTQQDGQRFDFEYLEQEYDIENEEEGLDSDIQDQQNDEITIFQELYYSIPRISQYQSSDIKQFEEPVISQKAQEDNLKVLAQFKALFELSIDQKKIIQLSLDDQQKDSLMIHQNGQADQNYENIIQQTIEANIQTLDQLDIMVQEAKENIIILDKRIQFDPNNYELYLEKSNLKLILAYDKLQPQQSCQGLLKVLVLVHRDIFNKPYQRPLGLQKKINLCQQFIQKLEKLSLDYLEIMMLILKTFDQENPENSEQIIDLKSLTITSQFEKKPIQLKTHQIEFLQQICLICISSIQGQVQVKKLRQIKNLKQQARIYIIFARMLTNHFKSTKNNQEFQQASELFQKIVCLLNETENEFPNNLGYLEFKLQILKEIIYMLDRDSDKIQFQQDICQLYERIGEKNPQILTLFYYDYELQQLFNLSNRGDVQILKKILTVYDKMLEVSEHDQDYFKEKKQSKKNFRKDCFIYKALIFEKIAKLQQSFKLKEEYYKETLDCYEEAYNNGYMMIINQIKVVIQIPVELGIENRWNKYYDYLLQVLEKSLNPSLLNSFINSQFEIIMQRISQQEKSLFAQELFKILNKIYDVRKNQVKRLFVQKANNLKKMGDLMKDGEQNFYYNEMDLLIKLNRKLEALSLTKYFFKYKGGFRKYCFKFLQVNQFLREARLVSRLEESSEINYYNVKALQNNL